MCASSRCDMALEQYVGGSVIFRVDDGTILRHFTHGNRVDVASAVRSDDPDTRSLGRMLAGQPTDLELHIRSRRTLRAARREFDAVWDHYLALAEWMGFDP